MTVATETWRVLGASVQGSSHIKRGIECQDAHVIRTLDDSKFVIAVADGAGSAKRASEGSVAASAAAADYLAQCMRDHAPGTEAECEVILRSSLAAARAKVESLPGPLAELATTLLICFVDKNWLGFASVGDGALVFRTKTDSGDSTLELVQPDRQSEYLNETDFVTSARGLDRTLLHVRPLDRVTAIAMFTDGVEWAAIQYRERVPHAAFFNPLFKHAASEGATTGDLDEFLRSPGFCEQTDDDKTLVLSVLA